MMEKVVINLGLYRTGTTSLAKEYELAGFQVQREPLDDEETLRKVLFCPEAAVLEWWRREGRQNLERALQPVLSRSESSEVAAADANANELDRALPPRCGNNEFAVKLNEERVYFTDNLWPLLPFLPREVWDNDDILSTVGFSDSISKTSAATLVCTRRDPKDIRRSELQHWARYNLAARARLSPEEYGQLGDVLESRARAHRDRVSELEASGRAVRFVSAPDDIHLNANPELPLEGILLTCRLTPRSPGPSSVLGGRSLPTTPYDYHHAQAVVERVESLLDALERDELCRYLLVVAVDNDEPKWAVSRLESMVERHHPRRAERFVLLRNAEKASPFPICRIWEKMACAAWDLGATWVVLLGDDVTIDCDFHYQAFYSAFADISQQLGVPFGFGCPWWNDATFPGFPTFPVVGREHYTIFGGLIPEKHRDRFVNQDLDPYLQRLYLAVGAAPPVPFARLRNSRGGEVDSGDSRYDRVSALGWRDWVVDVEKDMYEYLASRECEDAFKITRLVDCVVPTYRLNVDALRRIVNLEVPDNWRTTFIIIVDDPEGLHRRFQSAERLENVLRGRDGKNNVRVRKAGERNVGASAARNRGIEESAAKWILFLDDDVVPGPRLLHHYEEALKEEDAAARAFAGPVVFPRESITLTQAGVLASFLTYMFEYTLKTDTVPWAVTANLLIRRSSLRFDVEYAKTGGGEDVDFCLRLTATQGHIRTVPRAAVTHPFWSDNPVVMARHFFGWATGDGALTARFPNQTYRSWPNVAEIAVAVLVCACLAADFRVLVRAFASLALADVGVDCFDGRLRAERFDFLLQGRTKYTHCEMALIFLLAQFYIAVLELGRLSGHVRSSRFSSVCRRFDWHCGTLEHAVRRSRAREQRKFFTFLALTFALSRLF